MGKNKKQVTGIDIDKSFIETCENCGEKKRVRRVESYGSDFGGGTRGHFNLCFDCDGPKRTWRNRSGKLFITPVEKPEELTWDEWYQWRR